MWRRTPLPRISATPSTRSSRRCSVREPPPRTRTRTSSTSPKRFSRKSGECRTWFNISATEASADASPTPKEQIPFPVPATLSRSSNPPEQVSGRIQQRRHNKHGAGNKGINHGKGFQHPLVRVYEAFHGVIIKPQHHVGIQGKPGQSFIRLGRAPFPLKPKGADDNADDISPLFLGQTAASGATPDPVPPPSPAARTANALPSSARRMEDSLSQAAWAPTEASPPEPRPLVSLAPR